MAASRASFIPSFVNGGFTFGSPTVDKAFNTTRTGTDKRSAPVLLEAMHFDKKTQSIKAFCSDGNLRECRVERLPSIEAGRALWRQLADMGNKKEPITFIAAGGFSADKWFYTAE
jgi:hypothetical protein